MRLLHRLASKLEHPGATRRVLILALLLTAPALLAPLVADDLIHQVRVNPERSIQGWDDPDEHYFVFANGEEAQRQALMDEGIFSWWIAPGFKLAFYRPISEATHHLDDLLFGDNSVLIHAHSLLWFLLLLLALSQLYKRLHGQRVALIALCLYALDDARGTVLSFASNRNALIAAFFGVCVLIAHDRWRRDGWRPGALLAPLLLVAALLSGESALATTAFLFSYALFIDERSLRARMMSLVPYAALTLAWQLAYRHLGYGAENSGIYLHPLIDSAEFLMKLIERVPILALGQLATPPSDLWLFFPPVMKPYIYAFALLVTLAVGRLLWPLMRQSRLLCFWVLASGLSLIPIASTFTMDRLLVFVGIGASGALAMLFGYALQHPPGRWAARGVGALVVLHLVLSPMALPVRSLTMNGLEMINEDVDRSIPETENLAEKSLVVMQALSDGSVVYAQIERAAEGRPRPRSLRLLSTGLKQVEVTRLDAQTLHLRPERGFYETEGEQMGRHPKLPFKVGDEVVLKDMRVKVTHVDEHGRAMEAEFRFQSPLESPEWLWTHWVSGKLTPWRPPAIGETVILPPIL